MELQGVAASAGYAMGPVYIMQELHVKVEKKHIAQEKVEAELARLSEQVGQAVTEISDLRESTKQSVGEQEAEIFSAHLLVLQDPEYLGAIEAKIKAESIDAPSAVQEVTADFLQIFAAMDNEYIRERAADLRDVSQRLLRHLVGLKSSSLSDMADQVILAADDLTPSDTAQLDRSKVIGIITQSGGRTSHSAIMARSMELPAVVGIPSLLENVKQGDFVIIDGSAGQVLINPPEELRQTYRQRRQSYLAKREELRKMLNLPSVTSDGKRVELVANIGNPKDGEIAQENGAEGIGLFRTEFLYMSRDTLPTEEEQFQAYKSVAETFGANRPVVIRSLDIGGDKELPYLDMPQEMNPFLGYRAIRLCLDRVDIFKTQLRAILRASAYGNVKLMYPMIATLDELHKANTVLAEAKSELKTAGVPFNDKMEVGIMVEIPAVAVLADRFAAEVDFFSIGTNDLIQYTMAADRMNEKVSYLYQPLNPSLLRLIHGVIQAAHNAGKWVGMCGEMAGDLTAVPVLLGLGLDEFSMSASAVLAARTLIRSLDAQAAQKLAQEALQMNDAGQIRAFVEERIPLIEQLRQG